MPAGKGIQRCRAERKDSYPSREAAEASSRGNRVYACPHCSKWHMTSRTPDRIDSLIGQGPGSREYRANPGPAGSALSQEDLAKLSALNLAPPAPAGAPARKRRRKSKA